VLSSMATTPVKQGDSSKTVCTVPSPVTTWLSSAGSSRSVVRDVT
jgi:hypothetical protein